MLKPPKAVLNIQDREFQKRIIERDFNICLLHNTIQRAQYCLGIVGIAAHHIIKRKNQAVRHDDINGATLCLPCHTWAELNPTESEKLIINIFVFREIIPNLETWEKYKREVYK